MKLLKSRRFLPLFITQFLGAFNDNVFKNAFTIWVTYYTAIQMGLNAQVIVTIAFGLFILPFFLFSTIAGQIADKYEKSHLIMLIKKCEIILMMSVFFGFYFQSIFLLLSLLFLMGLQSAFFSPLKYSLIPNHLRNEELIQGNGLIESGTFLAILIGTIFGSIIVRQPDGIEFVSIAIVLFATLGYHASTYIPRSTVNDGSLIISFNIFKEMLKFFKFAKNDETVWLAIIGIAWFWFIGSIFLSQFAIYTKNVIGGDEYIYTAFLCIFSVGIATGSAICNRVICGKINGSLVPAGLIGITTGIAIFCTASFFYEMPTGLAKTISLSDFIENSAYSFLIMIGLFIMAISAGLYIVPLYAMLQHRSKQRYLSRIIATSNMLNALFMVASSMIILLFLVIDLHLIQIFSIIGVANLLVFFIIRKIAK